VGIVSHGHRCELVNDDHQPPSDSPPPGSQRVDAFRAVIGPTNQNYYLSYFRRAEERGYAPLSWNWAALIGGLFWLLWRKQYRWALFTIALAIGSSLVGGIIAERTGSAETGANAAYLLNLPYLMVYLPLKANGIYYEWCKQMIDTAARGLPAEVSQQQAWLTRRGGTNINLTLGLLVMIMLITLLSVPVPELASE